MKEKTSSLLFRLKTWSSFVLFILFIVSECMNFILQDTNKYHPCKITGGTRPRLIFRGGDSQWVIKCSVETRPKKACVSTLHLKWYLIISELQNIPWPRPANAYIDFITSSAALSELHCDCRLRIDPSAADAERPSAGLVWHRGVCQCQCRGITAVWDIRSDMTL